MEKLDNKELRDVNGGFLKISAAGAGILIGAAVSFALGAFSGYIRPYSCSYMK
jgi:lactobin A/cerein 7B family class IIb bacteriocin